MALHDPSDTQFGETPPPLRWQTVILALGGTPPLPGQTQRVGVPQAVHAVTVPTILFGGLIWLAGVFNFVGPEAQSVSGWTALSAFTVGVVVSVVDQIRHREQREAALREVMAATEERHQAVVQNTANLADQINAIEHTVEEESSELTVIGEKVRQGHISLKQIDIRIKERQAELAEATRRLGELRRQAMLAAASHNELAEAWAAFPAQFAEAKQEGKRESRRLFLLGLLMSVPLGFFVNWLSANWLSS
ncbi:hypothetical protein AB0B45_43180 [Nonomuraea sp. NPDC049152]|uniref:hypothetical protein n=1 Tax=Nonomuraea sp. NPDC049152 TaxID=3154350 RepID=UPI0033D4D0B6